MTAFTFNDGVPSSPNNPSVDQTPMLQNNVSNVQIWDVDHVGFNSTGSGGAGSSGGQHLQVTFNDKNVPGVVVDPISVLYTDDGTASTVADLSFKNQNGTFRISALKVLGVLTTVTTNGVVVPDSAMNVVSVLSAGNGTVYTINLVVGATNGTNVMVFTNISNIGTTNWTFAANTLTLQISSGSTNSRKLSFAIYQL